MYVALEVFLSGSILSGFFGLLRVWIFYMAYATMHFCQNIICIIILILLCFTVAPSMFAYAPVFIKVICGGLSDRARLQRLLDAAQTQPLSIPALNDLLGSDTNPTIYKGCPEGVAAELWTIKKGSHVPAFNANWSPEFVDWLLQQKKP